MKSLRLIFVVAALCTAVGLMVWVAGQPQFEHPQARLAPEREAEPAADALRLALVPERDIFEQRRRYQALVDYLETKIDPPIRLVTLNTYDRVLSEFDKGRIDAAFVGSMVAALAYDRLNVRVVANPRLPGDVTQYRGVLFVKADSPIQSVEQLRGRQIAGVLATTAGDLYPIHLMHGAGMLDQPDAPRMRWVGTHDEVILEVIEGRVDAGAAKDLRLDAWEAEHGQGLIRRLAISNPVPNNALVVRSDMDDQLVQALRKALVTMHTDDDGRVALAKFGATRFESCSIDQYAAFFHMTEALGSAWDALGIQGPPPKTPSTVNASPGTSP